MERKQSYKYKMDVGKYATDDEKKKKLKHYTRSIYPLLMITILGGIYSTFYALGHLNELSGGISALLGVVFGVVMLIALFKGASLENKMIVNISQNCNEIISILNKIIEFEDGSYIPMYEFIDKTTTTLNTVNINITRKAEPLRIIDGSDEMDKVKIDIAHRDYPKLDEYEVINKLLPFAFNNDNIEEIKKEKNVDTMHQLLQKRHTKALQEEPTHVSANEHLLLNHGNEIEKENMINKDLLQQLLDEQKELIKR